MWSRLASKLLCSLGWPGTCHLPALSSRVLGLQAGATTEDLLSRQTAQIFCYSTGKLTHSQAPTLHSREVIVCCSKESSCAEEQNLVTWKEKFEGDQGCKIVIQGF